MKQETAAQAATKMDLFGFPIQQATPAAEEGRRYTRPTRRKPESNESPGWVHRLFAGACSDSINARIATARLELWRREHHQHREDCLKGSTRLASVRNGGDLYIEGKDGKPCAYIRFIGGIGDEDGECIIFGTEAFYGKRIACTRRNAVRGRFCDEALGLIRQWLADNNLLTAAIESDNSITGGDLGADEKEAASEDIRPETKLPLPAAIWQHVHNALQAAQTQRPAKEAQ